MLEDARVVEEAEGTAAETSPALAELRVMVNLKGTRAIIGTQGANTDPVVETITIMHPEDALQEVFAAAADLVERARERWATSPRNPAYEGPPSPPPATPPQPARRQTAPTPAQPQRMF